LKNKEIFEIISMKLFLYFVVFIVIGMALANMFNKFYDATGIPPDNVVEETIEQIIEHQTGIQTDLSP
jgi:hypothetical protein